MLQSAELKRQVHMQVCLRQQATTLTEITEIFLIVMQLFQ